MNWFRENRWLGNFLIAFAAAMLLALWFLFYAKGAFADAMMEFNHAASERSRLEHLTPFPNEDNVKKTRLELENYKVRLDATKTELSAQIFPAPPLAPNEFQSHLRRTIVSTTERARTNRVKLPDNFHLGFDEFIATLPDTAAAAAMGQQLGQVELLVNILIDNHVDAITSVRRQAPATENAPATTSGAGKVGTSPMIVQRAVVDLAFTASPSALRKALNQIAGSERQFFIVRTLHVRNEQQKGPSREQSAAGETSASENPVALKFIVGNEHVEAAARVELVRFSF
jgi:hypothetical protein